MSYGIPNQLVLPRRQIRSAWYNALHQMDLGNDVNPHSLLTSTQTVHPEHRLKFK